MESNKRNIYEDALEYYERNLFSEEGKEAFELMTKEWGFTLEAIKEYRMGYAAKSPNALGEYLLGLGYTTEDIIRYSLAILSKEGEDEWMDRLQNRIVYPIRDESGEIIQFAGRKIDENDIVRYVLTRKTEENADKNAFFGVYEAIKHGCKKLTFVDYPMNVPEYYSKENRFGGFTFQSSFVKEKQAKAIGKYIDEVDVWVIDRDSEYDIKQSERLSRLLSAEGVKVNLVYKDKI